MSKAVIVKQKKWLIPLLSVELFREETVDDVVVESHSDISY